MVNLIARGWFSPGTLRTEVDTTPVGIERAVAPSNRIAPDDVISDMQAMNTLDTPEGVNIFIVKDDILWHSVTIEILLSSSRTDKY